LDVAGRQLSPKRHDRSTGLIRGSMLRFMNAPDPIPPFHRHPEANEGQQPLPRSITRVDSGPVQIDRVAALVHELDNLLDGSLRCVSLAVRTLNAQPGQVGLDEIDSVRHQLETAAKALERMAGLVHAAMRGRSYTIGSLTTDNAPAVTLRDAIEHAADVMRLSAQQHHTVVHVDVDNAIADCPAGPIYSALLNGIKNAVESVAAAGGRGTVHVTCRVEATATSKSRVAGSTQRWVRINVVDDGAGLARGVPATRLFDAGFTTKPDGHGIGLALTRSILERMGGHADLGARDDTSSRRPGAVLTLRFPIVETPSDERKVG
jgi:signal transduction histidine kinase